MKPETKTLFIIVGIIAILSYTGALNGLFFSAAIEETPTCREYQTINGVKQCKTFMTCETDANCQFCIGDIFFNESSELKEGYCSNGNCYVSEYCLNEVVIKDWLKAHPLAWIKKNVMLTIGIVAVLLFVVYAYIPRKRGKIRLF